MAEGASGVNGPHQGAWVDTPAGEHWFMHFQDKDAYGRVVHLQPMTWGEDGWPVIGSDEDGDGVGEPVLRWRKPLLEGAGVFQPAESDEFEDVDLGLQWQWHGVPSPYWYFMKAAAGSGTGRSSSRGSGDGGYGGGSDGERTDVGEGDGWTVGGGSLRMYSVQQADGWRNLGDTPNLLLQKTPADSFTATARVRFVPNPQLKEKGEACGLVLMGQDYAALKMVDGPDGVSLQYVECVSALKGAEERILASVPLESVALPEPYSNRFMSVSVPPVAPVPYAATTVYLRLKVSPVEREGDAPEMAASFWYSLDGKKWRRMAPVDSEAGSGSGGGSRPDGGLKPGARSDYRFTGAPGKWIGAKFGFFCNRFAPKNDSGWMEIDWIRVTE